MDTFTHHYSSGDIAIVLLESDDLATSLFGVATSTDPFDTWFRSSVEDIHPMDFSASPPPAPKRFL